MDRRSTLVKAIQTKERELKHVERELKRLRNELKQEEEIKNNVGWI